MTPTNDLRHTLNVRQELTHGRRPIGVLLVMRCVSLPTKCAKAIACDAEQMQDAGAVDARSDVYSLAMTTLFVLHGQPLTFQMFHAGMETWIRNLDCPAALKKVLYQATAPDPAARPPTMTVFSAMLSAAMQQSESAGIRSG